MSFTVKRIDHLVINVADLQGIPPPGTRACWACGPRSPNRRMILWFGEQKLHLRPVDASQAEWFTGRCPAAGSDDLCFAIDEDDLAAITAHLASCGVEIEVGPVERAGARGAMTSVYCRDPDGSLIEVSTYRAG